VNDQTQTTVTGLPKQSSSIATETIGRQKRLFNLPIGLTVLFLSQMWEQVSFFGMRSLLVYYMIMELKFAQPTASEIFGIYSASIFLAPILGGIASDRILGRRRSIIFGGLVMAAGHFLLALGCSFVAALICIAAGAGLFVPSLASQVGTLYGRGDPRQASSYSIYYVGVNAGAFLGPLLCGTLGEEFGWDWGFGAAGCGVLIGLLVYILGQKYLPSGQGSAAGHAIPDLREPDLRASITTLIMIGLIVAVFRISLDQIANTLMLWIGSSVSRYVALGFEIPRPWFLSLDPLFVLLLGPVLAYVWARQAEKGRGLSTVRKMTIGALLVGCALLLISAIAGWSEMRGGPTSWIWLVAFFLIFTTGELFIMPISLAVFGRSLPSRYAATAVAGWFLAGAVGNFVAGFVGTLWAICDHAIFFLVAAAPAFFAAAALWPLEARTRQMEAVPAGR
jgi:POT family proton-dependent oligopeptide transporter